MFEVLKYTRSCNTTHAGGPDAILTMMLSALMRFLVSARIFSAVNYRLKRRRLYLAVIGVT